MFERQAEPLLCINRKTFWHVVMAPLARVRRFHENQVLLRNFLVATLSKRFTLDIICEEQRR